MRKNLSLLMLVFFFAWDGVSQSKEIIHFDGEVDLLKRQFDLALKRQENPFLKIQAQKLSESEYSLFLKVDHLTTSKFDLSTEVLTSLYLNFDQDGRHKYTDGNIRSQYSLINFKPADELVGQFLIQEGKIRFTTMTFGSIALNGTVGFAYPYKLDLTVHLSSVDMNDFLNFWVDEKEFDSSGAVSGEIKISGALNKPFLKGSLHSEIGFVGPLEFDDIALNLEGAYPQMHIANSTVSKTNGMIFNFEGPINLGNQKNFIQQVKALNILPVVSESPKEREWTIKRVKSDSTGTTEIKYLLRDSDNTGSAVNNEPSMFAVEKKMEF